MWIITTPKISRDTIATEIISHYSIEKPSVSFIRHNENLTYQVVDESTRKKYLLRIHKRAGSWESESGQQVNERERYADRAIISEKYTDSDSPYADFYVWLFRISDGE